MKYVGLLIFTLSVSFGALAQLNPEEQKLADMLVSGSDKQLKDATVSIAKSANQNTELLDMVAEILLKKYPNAYPSEIDTLAWMARALGNSENGRYYNAVNTVVENAKHKKLVRHAETALDDIDEASGEQYVEGMASLPASLFARESNKDRDARVMALITAGDLRSLKEGARTIIDTRTENQALTDMLAEILITHHSSAADNQIDTFAWIARTLGQDRSGRYWAILEEVKENGANRKLRKYAKKALQEHGDAKGEQYKAGMLGKAVKDYAY
ncbi:hypothetical protein DRW07_16040 [Alteromonas sediminis]|uniref:HEAT repeat domain-containing protein n=1 Tax=Alteromonas sediminis TaxID=2259342 RepID=A0A3N5XX91_9ALTE|nr:hypothetical protein [Alteromonas sediminis]RPJ65412.1 hypothetical protein DRW07_16040 [Alteromonas sediminis]